MGETWTVPHTPLSLLYCADLLHQLMSRRSKWFWVAWHVQENGWVDWNPSTNNPFNISGPVGPYPWFRNFVKLQENNVAVYRDQASGLFATYFFLSHEWPDVVAAEEDRSACLLLDKPGPFGRWCPDPEYGNKILAILQKIQPAGA